MYCGSCFVSIMVVIKELVVSQMGENRQGFPSGFSFLFRRKLGPAQGAKVLGQALIPALASAPGTSFVWWSVSGRRVLSGILGLALNTSPTATCPHSQASEPQASAALLCRFAISLSREKKILKVLWEGFLIVAVRC